MSDNFEEPDDDLKNLYVIKRRLSDLKINKHGYFKYFVGNHYLIKIIPIKKFPFVNTIITNHEKVNVNVYELERDEKNCRWNENFIYIERDDKFRNYKPIQYATYSGNSDGNKMPILQLCELVKYLHRLANLSVFT